MITTIAKGNLTKDPELRSGGKTDIVTFDIAVTRPYSETTDFFKCVAFGTTAGFIDRNFQKGQPILIQGHLINDSYIDKDGNKRTITKIIADQVEFAGYCKNDNKGRNKSADTASTSFKTKKSDLVDLDDMTEYEIIG